MSPTDLAIHPGDRLMVTTAAGDKIPAVADSRPEGPGRCNACSERAGYWQSHNFAVVWVIHSQYDGTPSPRVPWPLESVRKVPDDPE